MIIRAPRANAAKSSAQSTPGEKVYSSAGPRTGVSMLRNLLLNVLLGTGLLVGAGVATAQPIKIGVISADSGAWALYGGAGKQGAVLAAEEINAHGGVLGRKLELITGDNKSRPDEASRLFRDMVAGGAEVVVGIVGTGEIQAASTLAREQKVPLLIAFGYGRFLTEEAG